MDSDDARLAALRDRVSAAHAELADAADTAYPTDSRLDTSSRESRATAPASDAPYRQEAEAVDLAALIEEERFEEVLAALANGAPPDGLGVDPWTPLHTAAALDDGAMCAALLRAGADATRAYNDEGVTDRWTAMHWACKHTATGDAARELLGAGADPFARSAIGETPLHVAARQGCEAVAQILVGEAMARRVHDASGAMASLDARNAQGETALHTATRAAASAGSMNPRTQASLAVAIQLMDAGANLNARNADGMTPLHLAFLSGSLPAVQMLAERGASLDALNTAGRTPHAEALNHARQPRALDAQFKFQGPEASLAAERQSTAQLRALNEAAAIAQEASNGRRVAAAATERERIESGLSTRPASFSPSKTQARQARGAMRL